MAINEDKAELKSEKLNQYAKGEELLHLITFMPISWDNHSVSEYHFK